jgi:hypothetical protein
MSESLSEPSAPTGRSGSDMVHRVSFRLNFRYYQALRDAKRKLSPTDDFIWRWRYALAFTVSGVVFFSFILSDGPALAEILSWEFLFSLAGMGLALPLMIFLIDLLFDQVLARWIYRRSSMAGQMVAMKLDDKRIAWGAEGVRAELDWTRVQRIVSLQDYLFFFFSKTEAIGLPREASAQSEFDSIVSFAQERVNGQTL